MKKSKLGYKRYSPDVNNPYNVIPSGRITMKDVDFPVFGIDNLGNRQMMYPGREYQFPGNQVFELPMAQSGFQYNGNWRDVAPRPDVSERRDLTRVAPPVVVPQRVVNDRLHIDRANQQDAGTISQYEEVSAPVKVLNSLAHPIEAGSYLSRGLPVPDRIGQNPTGMDMALDVVNPFAWANYGRKASNDLSEGNFTGAAFNALGALPAVGFASKASKSIPGVLNEFNLFNRAMATRPFDAEVLAAYNSGDKQLFKSLYGEFTPAEMNTLVPADYNLGLIPPPSKVYRSIYNPMQKSEYWQLEQADALSYIDKPIISTRLAREKATELIPEKVYAHKSKYNVGLSTLTNKADALNLAGKPTAGAEYYIDGSNVKGNLTDSWLYHFKVDPNVNVLNAEDYGRFNNQFYEKGYASQLSNLETQAEKARMLKSRGYDAIKKWGDSPELQFLNPSESLRLSKLKKLTPDDMQIHQLGGEPDPEMMFRDKYNTQLKPGEKRRFNRWAAKESKRQGRDILMDMGAYDIQGFWKSGDYKRMDQDNHGSDTWKKPNHPTFSNQSKYHGADGWYGGNWTKDGGYQPSKQTLQMYDPGYYEWMFGTEPNRPEHLDMSRYESGVNAPSPMYYQPGGEKTIELKEAEVIHEMSPRELMDAARFQWDDDINQTRLFERSKDFLKGWQNSPMYLKMLTKSAPKDWYEFDENRSYQLADAPKLDINRFDFSESSYGAYSPALHQVRLNRRAFPSNSIDQDFMDTYVHELTHATDVKRGDILLTKPFVWNWELSIPEADTKLMKKLINPSLRNDEYASNPSEIRARINAARQQAKDAGIYDPYTEKFTRKTLKKLLDLNADSPTNRAIDDLNFIFPKANDLIKIMNSVSDNSLGQDIPMAQDGIEVPNRVMYWSNPDDAEWFNSHAVFSPEGPGKHDDQVRQMVRLGHGYNPSTGTIHFSKNPVPISGETRYYDDLGAIQRSKAEYAEEKRQQQKEWNNARKPVLISNEEWWNPNFNFETLSGTANARDFAGQTVYMTPEEFNAYTKETVRHNMEKIHKESAIWTLPGTIATSAFAPSMFVPSAMYHTAEGIKEEDYLKAGLNSLMVIPAVRAAAGPVANTVKQGAKYAGNAILNTADKVDRALMHAQPSRIRDAAYAYNSGSRVLSPNELRVLQKYGNIHAPEIYNPLGKNHSYINHLQRGLFGTRDAMVRPANLTTLDRYKNFNPWKSERWDPSIGRDFMRQKLNPALQTRFDRAGVRIPDLPSGSSISSATYVEPIGANVARQNFNGQFSMNPPRFWSDENIRNSILNFERNLAIHDPINNSNAYLNPIRNRVAGYDPLFDVRRNFGPRAKNAVHPYGDFGQADYQTAFPRRTTTEGPGRINNFNLNPELSGVAEENIARLDYSDRILGRLNRNYRTDLREGFTNLERPFLENPSLIPTPRPVGSRGMYNWPETQSYRSERFTPSGVHPSYNQNFRPQRIGVVEDPTTGKLIDQYSIPRTTRMRRGTANTLESNQIQFPQHFNINRPVTDFKVPGREDRISQVTVTEAQKALSQISSDIPINQYVFEFNNNLDELNRIIKANNKSGWDWKVNRLTNDGVLEIGYPAQNWMGVPVDAGTTTWNVHIRPGRVRGNVELVPNMSYYYNLPGLNMRNTSKSVFPRNLMLERSIGNGPIKTPKGTGAYTSINQYLKDFNLGRVKPGFNSQTADSYNLWKKAILEGKAFGFEPEGNLIYGAMKRKGGETLPKAQFGLNSLTPIVTPFMAAYDAGVAVKDWFSDIFSDEPKPEVTVPVKEEKPVDWTTLSRPDQINYGINEVLKYDAPEKRQAVENLLRATAYMENTYGADPNAYGRDYTNSFMSIDPIALTDLFTGRGYKGAYNSSQQNYLKSMEALGLPADKDQYKDLLQQDNPVAAMMAARARYALVPEPLPSANDVEGMFNYWLKYYNGNGVLKHKTRQQAFNDFVEGYRSVIGGN